MAKGIKEEEIANVVKKKFEIKGFAKLKEEKRKEIEAEIVNTDDISIGRKGGINIISKIFLTHGEVQTIKKLALKNFKAEFKNGKMKQDIDLSSLSEFRPDTDKGVQLLLIAIKDINGKKELTKEDVINATDTEVIDKLLEILLEENGLSEKKDDEEKND